MFPKKNKGLFANLFYFFMDNIKVSFKVPILRGLYLSDCMVLLSGFYQTFL